MVLIDSAISQKHEHMDKININTDDMKLNHIVCCVGDFNEDGPRIIVDELKQVLCCSLCDDKFHLWCL